MNRLLLGVFVLITGSASAQTPALNELKASAPAAAQDAAPATPPSAPAQPAAAADRTPGHFDAYVLALSWEPAFCTTPAGAGKAECAPGSGRFSDTDLILHGLWPGNYNDPTHSYSYCGVDDATRSRDKPGNRGQLPPTGLSDGLQQKLKEHMPGIMSLMDRHEWYTHGVCSGLPAEDYFTLADGLTTGFAASNAGRFISANVGAVFAADALIAAFASDYGPDSAKSVNLYCLKGSADLSEVRIYLAHASDLSSGFAGHLVKPDVSEHGDCPAQIHLIPAKTK